MAELRSDLQKIAHGGTVKRGPRTAPGLNERLKTYAVICLLGVIGAFGAASYELWAPPITMYMNIPLMDRNQAETLMALRQANALRVAGTIGPDKIDKAKFDLAEANLKPFANSEHSWNMDAAHKLAALYAMNDKPDEARKLARTLSHNDERQYAVYLHNIGVGLDHSQGPAHARPLMEEAHKIFVQKNGPDDPATIKELFNLSQVDLQTGDPRVLSELQELLPKLKGWNPSLEPTVRKQIEAVKAAANKSGHAK